MLVVTAARVQQKNVAEDDDDGGGCVDDHDDTGICHFCENRTKTEFSSETNAGNSG